MIPFHLHKGITEQEARECAELMCNSAPWSILNRSFQTSLNILLDKSRDVYVIKNEDAWIGFIVVNTQGALTPYIQSILLKQEYRNQGIGSAVLNEIENIYSSVHSRIFLMVSSFNEKAQKLYQSMKYQVIGVLPNHVVEGHAEILMRKILAADALRFYDAGDPQPWFSTDKRLMNTELILGWLRNTHWAKALTKENLTGRMMNSLCFGIFLGKEQIGFARVITDYFSFAYLADVVIAENQRGKGFGKMLVGNIIDHPDLYEIKWLLSTLDAHGLYRSFGFDVIVHPERVMGTKNWLNL